MKIAIFINRVKRPPVDLYLYACIKNYVDRNEKDFI